MLTVGQRSAHGLERGTECFERDGDVIDEVRGFRSGPLGVSIGTGRNELGCFFAYFFEAPVAVIEEQRSIALVRHSLYMSLLYC